MVRLVRPYDLVVAVRAVLGWTDDTVSTVATLPARISAVIDEFEALISRIHAVTDRVDRALDRVEPVVAQAAVVAGRADLLVGDALGTSAAATALLERYEPIATALAPMAQRLADGISETEVDAVLRLVTEVPVFASRMDAEVIPVLTTLDRIGPDVRDLLAALHDVQHTLRGLPGFTMFRRRAKEIRAERKQ